MNAIPPENIALLVGCFTMFASGVWLAFKLRGENKPPQITQPHPRSNLSEQLHELKERFGGQGRGKAFYELSRTIQPDLEDLPQEKIKVITRHGEIADIDPRDLRTLKELGFQPRREREEKREEPEPRQQQGIVNLPSRDVYLCLECGRRVEYIEHAKIYKPGVGLIAIPRCPFCGAPVGPPKVTEKEEAELPSLRAIEPPRFPEKKPKGLGIERPRRPSLEEEVGEAGEDEES